MKAPIENKLKELYDYIRNFQRENRFPPTVREIQTHFGIKSTASVSYYLKQLEANGLIRHSKQKKRCIEVVGESKVEQVPLLGDIAAGTPILAVENIDSYVPLPEGFFGKGGTLFMLRVRGTSMIEVGITSLKCSLPDEFPGFYEECLEAANAPDEKTAPEEEQAPEPDNTHEAESAKDE